MKSCHQLLKNEAAAGSPLGAFPVAALSPTTLRVPSEHPCGFRQCHQLVSCVTNSDVGDAVNLSPTVSSPFRGETVGDTQAGDCP